MQRPSIRAPLHIEHTVPCTHSFHYETVSKGWQQQATKKKAEHNTTHYALYQASHIEVVQAGAIFFLVFFFFFSLLFFCFSRRGTDKEETQERKLLTPIMYSSGTRLPSSIKSPQRRKKANTSNSAPRGREANSSEMTSNQ